MKTKNEKRVAALVGMAASLSFSLGIDVTCSKADQVKLSDALVSSVKGDGPANRVDATGANQVKIDTTNQVKLTGGANQVKLGGQSNQIKGENCASYTDKFDRAACEQRTKFGK